MAGKGLAAYPSRQADRRIVGVGSICPGAGQLYVMLARYMQADGGWLQARAKDQATANIKRTGCQSNKTYRTIALHRLPPFHPDANT